ncbi:MAG: valine--tRNA ligase [Saprospirales bacterium]|nr:valine--tRNA ligase [Saprospirales bacterium]
MTNLSTRYTPQEIEDKWYAHWMKHKYFHSVPDEREPYTIVIPPPNVTGVLHMGHMLNNTIQDILIRKARLEGKNACWVPGTDHASIATEAKVVGMLRERGIKKSEIGRDEFLRYAFEWKDKYGGIILEQLKKLGASCDWERTRFTMEESLSQAVLQVFNDLYKKGWIYRGKRMTNWDPDALTVLSNEEVIYSEENSRLYYVRYKVEGTEDEWVTIATVRPETILGDTAIAVHPDDERYAHLQGKRVIVPLINRSIPVIFDDYVDREFGTGALKITPAHDVNDFEIGAAHGLEVIDVMNDNGTMSEAAQLYIGEDRFKARKLAIADLEAAGDLVKIEDYRNKVGRSERTNAIVEPRLTLQWFLDMKEFAKIALHAVKSGEVRFFPEHFYNMFQSWLKEDNIRDWCISRQLWWGQRIPAWYYGEEVFVAMTGEEALKQAREKTGNANLTLDDLHQEEDVVDTWFSSWLWPISVFDGFAKQDELRYYYPTNVLVTGWDIMFFWVARMIMVGYEWTPQLLGEAFVKEKGAMPFHDVYFTGMVRDNKRRKMSKSLGNSPDALELIHNYGADSVRFGMLSSAAAGNDIIFDAPFDPETKAVLNESKMCEQGRNFCNKMWNALRLVKGWKVGEMHESHIYGPMHDLAIEWMEHKFNQVLTTLEGNFKTYRLSDSLIALYTFIWDDFCAWYLEMIKPEDGVVDADTMHETQSLFERMMTVLHPFMPFITEELWHQLRDRKEGDDCVVSSYPVAGPYDEEMIGQVEKAKDLIAKVREIRNNNGLKARDPLRLFIEDSPSARKMFNLPGLKEMVMKLAFLSELEYSTGEVENTLSILSGTEKYHLEVPMTIDVEAEREKIQKELEYFRGFVTSVEKKLSNERFVGGAPADVVERERQKMEDGKAKMKILEESLKNLG